MPARRLEHGWSTAERGSHGLRVQEFDGVTDPVFDVYLLDGDYCHTPVGSVASTYVDLASQLKARLDAASPNAWTYTVAWNADAGTYTISASGGDTALTFSVLGDAGARMREALGFQGDRGRAPSHTSDAHPWYYLRDEQAQAFGWDADSGEYDPGGRVTVAVAADGTSYAQGPSGAVRRRDFELQAMPRSKTFRAAATASRPYTWQHFVELAGAVHPVFAWDGLSANAVVGYLAEDGAEFTPRVRARTVRSSDLLWDWRVRLLVAGEVPP